MRVTKSCSALWRDLDILQKLMALPRDGFATESFTKRTDVVRPEVVMNHSPSFYAEVLKVYPEYYKWDGWLKEHGEAIMRRMTG